MNSDKQIEEMADIITDAMINGAENLVDCVVVAVEKLVAKGYRKASDVAREIFEELESVFYLTSYTVQRPMGSLTTKTIEGIHMRNEDYHTIKKKYTEGGNEK